MYWILIICVSCNAVECDAIHNEVSSLGVCIVKCVDLYAVLIVVSVRCWAFSFASWRSLLHE